MPTSAKLQVHPISLLKLLLSIGFVLALVSIIVQVAVYQAGENSVPKLSTVEEFLEMVGASLFLFSIPW